MSDSPRLTLTIPSELRMLTVARAFVEAVCQTRNLDKRTTHSIILATGEALSNIIRHAHRNRPDAQIQVQCQANSHAFEVTLLDEGEPFDLNQVPHLDPGEIRVGGRGVFLMRKLMDELVCEARGPHGNLLRMVKRCAEGATVREVG